MGQGMQRLCKMYGGIKFQKDGKTVEYEWDYANDEARLKGEMTPEEIKASEKAKWELIKNQM